MTRPVAAATAITSVYKVNSVCNVLIQNVRLAIQMVDYVFLATKTLTLNLSKASVNAQSI